MFIRASTLFSVAALTGVVSAVPAALEARDVCNSGSLQCCNSVQDSSSSHIWTLFEDLELPFPSPGTQIGLTCSPFTLGGSGSGGICTQQTVCCNGNIFNGAIATGCFPISTVLNAGNVLL